jgi:hypothetical protein
MKDLLIGTALVDDSPGQLQWLDLQLSFIRATTEDFDHLVITSGEVTDPTFAKKRGSQLIRPVNQFDELGGSRAHQQSLNILADYFHRQKDNYRLFLFLDCDAFPVRKNWLQILCQKMTHHEIAAIVRTENLELRFHASVMLAKPEALPHLEFKATVVGYDLEGDTERDLNPVYYQQHKEQVLGMVRSNRYNVHPVACGIYFDMFYHHSNGSDCRFVEKSKHYWDHVVEPLDDLRHFKDLLMQAPDRFLESLGWRTGEYVTLSPEEYAILSQDTQGPS